MEHLLIISNVPKTSVVSDTGVVEEVTAEHIFDTVLLIDKSVNRVVCIDESTYMVYCDHPELVKNALDQKMIGTNIIQIAIGSPSNTTLTHKTADYFNIVSVVIICSVSVFFWFYI